MAHLMIVLIILIAYNLHQECYNTAIILDKLTLMIKNFPSIEFLFPTTWKN